MLMSSIFTRKIKVMSQHKVILVIVKSRRKRHCFPQSTTPSNGGTTGTIVGTRHCKRKWFLLMEEEKNKMRVRLKNSEQKGVDSVGSAQELRHSLLPHWYVFLIPPGHEKVQNQHSSSDNTCLLINKIWCFTLPFHRNEIRASRSNCVGEATSTTHCANHELILDQPSFSRQIIVCGWKI